MYNDTANGLVEKHPLDLPEAMGPIIHLQEKLFVPVKDYPDVSDDTLSACTLKHYMSTQATCTHVQFWI